MHAKKDKARCILCDAVASTSDKENLVVYRGALSFVILNRYPYTSGHLMIAPYDHVARLHEASEAASREMMQLMRRAERILEELYRPDGLNLGMNLGEAAGAGVDQHIHMHVLPRWNGDANFMTTVGETRVIPEALDDSYERLKGRFQVPQPPHGTI
jgi:ATP adenylyltransferase